ncbi:MAG: hypothetical protein V1737_01810 [Chloroflexota bacterium]
MLAAEFAGGRSPFPAAVPGKALRLMSGSCLASGASLLDYIHEDGLQEVKPGAVIIVC